MNRRDYMKSVSALAVARRGTPAEDYDVDEPDTQLREGWFAHFEATRFSASYLGDFGGFELIGREVDEQLVEVAFDSDGVLLTVDGRNDDYSIDAGAMGVLEPEEAREVAAAIYRAAEEVEARYDL